MSGDGLPGWRWGFEPWSAHAPVASADDLRTRTISPTNGHSHFETTAADVLSLYKRITGQELDLTISADSTNPDDY